MNSHVSLLLALLLAGSFGCARQDIGGARPSGFASAAESFRAKSGRDRRPEGELMQSLLPCCPKTWEKDIGTGTLMAFDYAHPSYKLTKPELFRALGQPDSSYNDTVWYVLVHDTNDMLWQISVQFHDDYVVGSTITGSPKKDR